MPVAPAPSRARGPARRAASARSSAAGPRVEYASSSVTRRTAASATDARRGGHEPSRSPARSRAPRAPSVRWHPPPARRGDLQEADARRPAAATNRRRRRSTATDGPGRFPPSGRSTVSARSTLRSVAPERRRRARVGGERPDAATITSAGWCPDRRPIGGPELGCRRGGARPAAAGARPVREAPGSTSATTSAPSAASRAPSEPASSSERIGSARRASTGPVSSPSSIRITVTPVTASPASIACWTGLAPRHRGSSEKCRFTEPRRGASARRRKGSRRRPRRRHVGAGRGSRPRTGSSRVVAISSSGSPSRRAASATAVEGSVRPTSGGTRRVRHDEDDVDVRAPRRVAPASAPTTRRCRGRPPGRPGIGLPLVVAASCAARPARARSDAARPARPCVPRRRADR